MKKITKKEINQRIKDVVCKNETIFYKKFYENVENEYDISVIFKTVSSSGLVYEYCLFNDRNKYNDIICRRVLLTSIDENMVEVY